MTAEAMMRNLERLYTRCGELMKSQTRVSCSTACMPMLDKHAVKYVQKD
jgi:hypothetical protein